MLWDKTPFHLYEIVGSKLVVLTSDTVCEVASLFFFLLITIVYTCILMSSYVFLYTMNNFKKMNFSTHY